MTACLVYITASNAAEAEHIGRALVEARLAACANVHPSVTSIYRWQGKIETESETVLIAKTRESLVDALTEKVVSLHEYDCPCIVAVPIAGGHQAFLDWIVDETVSRPVA
jgi:periplasmic divalent cation tolerance protein